MRSFAVAAATALALAAAPATPAAPVGAVVAGGEVTVFHAICDSLGTGDIQIALEPRSTAEPADAWVVQLYGHSTSGCEAHVAGMCTGLGTLAEAIKLSDCSPAVSGGSVGPVLVCIPGPARGARVTANGFAAIDIAGVMGSFTGTVPAIVAGGLVDEAANICD